MQGPDFDQDWFVVEFPGRSRGAFSADHVRPANAEGCRALARKLQIRSDLRPTLEPRLTESES
jgi:hypothetical protein